MLRISLTEPLPQACACRIYSTHERRSPKLSSLTGDRPTTNKAVTPSNSSLEDTIPAEPSPHVSVFVARLPLPVNEQDMLANWPTIEALEALDLLLPEDARRLKRELDRSNRERSETDLENLRLTLAEYLRYAFTNGVDVVFFNSILPAACLEELEKFSARMTIISPVAASAETQWLGYNDRRFTKSTDVALVVVSPYVNSVQNITQTLSFRDFDPRLNRRSKVGHITFDLTVSNDKVIVNSSLGLCATVEKLPGSDPGILMIDVGTDNIISRRVFPLYDGMDNAARELKAALADITRSSDQKAELECVQETLDGAMLSARERAALNEIHENLNSASDSPMSEWDVLTLPPGIRTPTAIAYASLLRTLGILQSALAAVRACQNKEATQLLEGLWEKVSRTMRTLMDVPEKEKRLEDRTSIENSQENGHHTLFFGQLTTQSDEDLERAFTRQARLLSVLNSFNNHNITLAYQLSTFKDRSGNLRFSVSVVCTVKDVTEIEASELRSTLGQFVHSTFLGIFGLSFSLDRDPSLALEALRRRYVERIVFSESTEGWIEVPTFPDWAHLIDFMSSLDRPATVVLSASRGGELDASNANSLPDVHDVHAVEVIDEAVARTGTNREYVELELAVASDDPIPSALLKLMASEVGPGASFEGITPHQTQKAAIGTALRVFHPPFGDWYLAHGHAPSLSLGSPLASFPVGGLFLGHAQVPRARGNISIPVCIPESDRLRHVYVIGKTGSGKTNLLRGMVAQDLQSPSTGLAVVDPHGDLAQHLLNLLPAGRRDDLQLVDLSDPDLTPVLNPLITPGRNKIDRSRVSQEVLRLLKLRVYHEQSGPRFDAMIRLLLDTMLDDGYPSVPSLVDASQLLTDDAIQKRVRRSLRDGDLKRRWNFHDTLKSGRDYPDLLDWALSKLDDIQNEPVLRAVLGGERNTVDIDRVVANNGILVVSIPESVVGTMAAEFIGSLVLLQLKGALMRRTPERTPPFFLYVDEFQKFANIGFEEILAEGRKFGVGLIMAHQNTEQLRKFSINTGESSHALFNSILGNTGTILSFGIGAQDAALLSPQLGISEASLARIGRFEAVGRLSIDGNQLDAFTIKTAYAAQGLDPRNSDDIREYLTRHALLAQRTDVDSQIMERQESLRSLSFEKGADIPSPEDASGGSLSPLSETKRSFLDEWLAKRKALKQPHAESPDPHEPPSQDPRGRRSAPNASWHSVIGPVVRIRDVATYVSRSEAGLRADAKRGLLMVLRTQEGTEVIPVSHLADHDILPGLRPVLRTLAEAAFDDWTKAAWLATPNAALGRKSPLDCLRSGRSDDLVLAVAEVYAEES